MVARSNNKTLTRGRLCALAEIQRTKHRRWIDQDLLPAGPDYGESDLIRAAALDELTRRLSPRVARAAWEQIRDHVDLPLGEIEVVVAPSTLEAHLIRNEPRRWEGLPRNEPIIIVPLHERLRETRRRLDAYRRAGS